MSEKSHKIKVGALPILPLDDNPLADWSAALFVAGRTQYILLSNTKSLFSTVLAGNGIVSSCQFVERALISIRELMEAGGRQAVYRKFVAPASATVRFARALNRSVTGSMNDLIGHAAGWLAEAELSPQDVAIELNDILLSALTRSKSLPYGRPRDAFNQLVSP